MKLAYGPQVVKAMNGGLEPILSGGSPGNDSAPGGHGLRQHRRTLVVATLNRPRHQEIITEVRRVGSALRLLGDGDITLAVAPSLPGLGCGSVRRHRRFTRGYSFGGRAQGLGGGMLLRMWPRDAEERSKLLDEVEELERISQVDELVMGDSALFCATGLSDSALLPGVQLIGKKAITHSILMRARAADPLPAGHP